MLHGGGLFVAFSQRGQSGAVSPLVSHAVTEHSYRVVTRDKQTDGKEEKRERERERKKEREREREREPCLKYPPVSHIEFVTDRLAWR